MPENFYLFSNVPIFKDGVHFICEKGLEIILVVFTAITDKSSRNFCVFLPIPNKEYEDTIEKIFERKHQHGEIRLSAFPEDISKLDYIEDLERIQRLDNWFGSL